MTQGRSKLPGSVRQDEMRHLLLVPMGPGQLWRQEGISLGIGGNASKPRAGAGTWSHERGTGGKPHPSNGAGSGLHRPAVGSVVQWTEAGGGGRGRGHCRLAILALPPTSCVTSGKSLLLQASMSSSLN